MSKIKATNIQVVHHTKFLDARNQERLVQSQEFVELWESSNNNERKKILFLLKKIKPRKLRELMGKCVDLATIELRKLASYYRIKNYSRKTRYQLIVEIEGKKRNDKKISPSK